MKLHSGKQWKYTQQFIIIITKQNTSNMQMHSHKPPLCHLIDICPVLNLSTAFIKCSVEIPWRASSWIKFPYYKYSLQGVYKLVCDVDDVFPVRQYSPVIPAPKLITIAFVGRQKSVRGLIFRNCLCFWWEWKWGGGKRKSTGRYWFMLSFWICLHLLYLQYLFNFSLWYFG